MKPKNGVYKSLGKLSYLYGVCPLVAGNNLWAIDVFYFIYKSIIPRLDIFVNKNYNHLFIYFYG